MLVQIRSGALPACRWRRSAAGAPAPLVTEATPPSAAVLPRPASEFVAAQVDTVVAAAEGCDSLVATAVIPAGVRL
jgi:hypothetical protein